MSSEIRVGQLIVPFGPGSLYTEPGGTTLVIGGLDYWHRNQENGRQADDRGEFEIHDPRLCRLLRVQRLYAPPDWRNRQQQQDGQQQGEPPPNACLGIPVLRFPTWYRNNATRELRQFNLSDRALPDAPEGGQWHPVRFVAVCPEGHLQDFPWKVWCGCTCEHDMEQLVLWDGGGGNLSSVRISCKGCGKSKDLEGILQWDREGNVSELSRAGIRCRGARPWLGDGIGQQEGCDAPLVGALINQTNLWFGSTLSSILLPDTGYDENLSDLVRNLHENPETCTAAKVLWNIDHATAITTACGELERKLGLQQIDRDRMQRALEVVLGEAELRPTVTPSHAESEEVSYRRTEFEVLRNELIDRKRSPDLRIRNTTVPDGLDVWIDRVTLVERLKATTAFCGFSRLERRPVENLPRSALNQLFRNPPRTPEEYWLPAVEVFGEGIYLEIGEQAISDWLKREGNWLANRLDDQYRQRLATAVARLSPVENMDWQWAAKFLMLHSLAHVLIGQLVFECGYSTAALRERLYVSADPKAPMAGMLIYTAAGDSEGTLGGLVRTGRPDRFGEVFRNAVSRASWCSADPVCSEDLGGRGARQANLAACHACTLLPETSCETINEGLDRAMLVGTPEHREGGFFSGLLDGMVEFA